MTTLLTLSLMCLLSHPCVSSQEITFMEPGSFVELDAYSTGAITTAEVARSGISFEFSFMTDSITAILLYAAASDSQQQQQQMSSIPSHPDVSRLQQQHQLFIAAEVINGKTVLSMNDGSGVVALHSEVIVNDGVWHRVNAIFSPSHMEVNVDGNSKFLRPSSSSSIGSGSGGGTAARIPKTLFDQIDFSSVYIGGMHSDREYNALQQAIVSILSAGSALEASLTGCVKEMRLNRKVIGIKSSTGTSTGTCGFKFKCLLTEPCIDEAECFQEGLDGFHCVCDQPPCERSNQSAGTGSGGAQDQHRPQLNVHDERGSSDRDREVSRRVQAGEQGITLQPQLQQTNYRQRNHHRQRGSTGSATQAGSSSSSSSSPTSSSTAALSSTPSPSFPLLTKGLSLASAAQENSGKGSPLPVNHLSVEWKQDADLHAGSQAETNLMQQPQLRRHSSSSSGSTTSVQQEPTSFINYLGTVVSKEQAITCFIVAVISLIAIVLVAMVRGFYLYGRRKENRRQSHKDLNLHSSNNSSSGRKDSETTTSACTPLPLGSDFDDPSDLLSHPSDLLSPPSISSRLAADFPEQPVAPPVHNCSTFGRSINRRESSLFLPLPPPSFYFSNTATSFNDLPPSPFRFSEYRD